MGPRPCSADACRAFSATTAQPRAAPTRHQHVSCFGPARVETRGSGAEQQDAPEQGRSPSRLAMMSIKHDSLAYQP